MKMILRFEIETDNASEQFANELIRHVESTLEVDYCEGAWGGYEGPFVRTARGSLEA